MFVMHHGSAPELERMSTFVVQVLPSVLSGLIALFIPAAAFFDWRAGVAFLGVMTGLPNRS
jgi:hypothetical protein